ncbi:MAG: GIY-YIG nuclease family protein [Candidatus Omnitrophica bacterium]|nr:GIY-YIG nuclease family protein [Candidatus Omnitrophota bacterium]
MIENKKSRPAGAECWFLYILECNDGSFYTGITNNLTRRVTLHQNGKASRFTRTRRPVKLLYQEHCLGRREALVRECAVKSLSRKKKEALIAHA